MPPQFGRALEHHGLTRRARPVGQPDGRRHVLEALLAGGHERDLLSCENQEGGVVVGEQDFMLVVSENDQHIKLCLPDHAPQEIHMFLIAPVLFLHDIEGQFRVERFFLAQAHQFVKAQFPSTKEVARVPAIILRPEPPLIGLDGKKRTVRCADAENDAGH